MQDKTAIRLAELACGGFALFIHAQYGINTFVILIVCVLWGIPLDLVIEAIRKRKNNG